MPLERLGSPVRIVSTYLTRITDIQPMQLVQPIGNGFSVPAQGKIFRVVRDLVVFVITVCVTHVLVIALLAFCVKNFFFLYMKLANIP